jgi:Outer membrane protein beta-barrel domain/PDZ domain
MLKLFSILAIVFCLSGPAFAQEAPRVEIFGGYSYLNFDFSTPSNGVLDRENFNGWEASATFNVNRWFGLEGDFSGHYKGDCLSVPGLTCKDYSFMGGPRFAYRRGRTTVFAHGLFGADHGSGTLTISGVSASLSDTPFALAAGGGFDYVATQHISIRIGQVDYFMTRHAHDLLSAAGLPAHQNNIRVSAGVVFTFGRTHAVGKGPSARTPTEAPRRAPTEAPAQTAVGNVAPSLGVSGYASEQGFTVTSVQPGSPAQQAGINPGDVIAKIDDRPVHTGQEIEVLVSTSPSGTVKVMYWVGRAWPVEKEIKVR